MSAGSPRRWPTTKKRLADIQTLAADDANTQFQAQDKQVQYETVSAQLGAAKAAQQSATLALDSEIGGVNTTVAQLQAQLDNANWELSQATVRAPADGYVTLVTVTVGDRALHMHSAMSFIVDTEITLVGMFSQNGFQTVKEGTAVDIVFDNAPGRIYHARITAIAKGIGQGQVAVSGTLARTSALGGATVFPAEISIPRRDEPRPASAGNVGQRHRLCRQFGCDGRSGIDSGVGGFLHGISLAGQAQNARNARKKRASLDCAARFR
jgi:multidrug resistance efflux pump